MSDNIMAERLRAELVEERHTVLEIVRSQDEFGEPHGLPWGVSPWGDGSSTTGNSNIISDRWQVVIASEMPTETAEFIVASVNQIERLRAAMEKQGEQERDFVLEVAAKIADEFADMFRTEPPYSDNFWAGANIAKAIRALKDVRPDDRSAAG